MRCIACNKNLSDFESTRKYADSQQYVDLCNKCFSTISDSVTTVERLDLKHLEEEDFDLEETLE